MKVFVDTSIFFKWLYGFKKYWRLDFVKKMQQKYNFIISGYVINEILDNKHKLWKNLTDKDIFSILKRIFEKYKIQHFLWELVPENSDFFDYVNDPKDTQILYDAISAGSDILLTDNLKDFKIAEIQQKFNY